ncbi:MAG: PQQ-dependent sugar dehydrogenase [Pyrinomonadaceae bacterium]|nr:PQQ-dependent sugar dehydrogenase [Phycisphaerales bacterium]
MTLGMGSHALAQVGPPITSVRVASGLTQPLNAASAPGDFSRLFIVERTGRIKILQNGVVNPTPFLNVSSLISTSWLEYGLLGLTFHPGFQQNGFFYVNYTPPNGSIADTQIVRYRVSTANPNVADTSTATTILRFNFGTRREHRAGWMAFGPDGYLYVSTGDGGENDPDNAAQNLGLLRGKLLRLDVNGADGTPGTADDNGFPADATRNYQIPASNPFAGQPGVAPELWAVGLRNPWRCSFDRLTGDLWIGDVGQAAREEVNFQAAASRGGTNYGWRCTEGTFCTGLSGCMCNGAGLTPPVYEYPRSMGVSVTCGYVYRGCAIPGLEGTFFFADYQANRLWSLRYSPTGGVTDFTNRQGQLTPPGQTVNSVASFAEDAYGELYMIDYSGGEVFKIVPATFIGPDCNENARRDACDILDGLSLDADGNGVPDECDPPLCPADFDADGAVNSQDFFLFLAAFFDNQLAADFNHDLTVDSQDFFAYVAAFFKVCP